MPGRHLDSPASPYRVRPAAPSDYVSFTLLFPELEIDDPVPSRRAWETSLAPSAWMAVSGDDVVGYCICQQYDDTGYVRHLAVAPRARRSGVGGALMGVVAEALRGSGKTAWCLNVKEDNHPALALYRQLGLRVHYLSTALRLPWRALPAVPPGDAIARELSPTRDRVVEERFDMPSGQLRHLRGSGRLLLESVSTAGAAPTGFAAFDAGYPGAFPFRAADTNAAGALLRAMRSRVALQELVYVVAEDDAPLRDLLIAAGATVRASILHLRGPL